MKILKPIAIVFTAGLSNLAVVILAVKGLEPIVGRQWAPITGFMLCVCAFVSLNILRRELRRERGEIV